MRRRSAAPLRATLKSIGVLMALVAHTGQAVSREALPEWGWPDTLATDDALTQAIAQLRRVFGEERGNPHSPETLAE